MNFLSDIVSDFGDSYNRSLDYVSSLSGNRVLPGDSSDYLGAALATPIMLASHWLVGNDVHDSTDRSDPRISPSFRRPVSQRVPEVTRLGTPQEIVMPNGKVKYVKKAAVKAAKKEIKKEYKRVPGRVLRGAPRLRGFRGRGRRRIAFGNRKQLVQRITNQPVAKGFVLNPGPGMEFFQSRRPGCMGIQGRCRIGSLSTSSTGFANLQTSGGVGSVASGGSFPIAPFMTALYPAAVSNFTNVFQRFSISCRFLYVPSCPTSQAGTLSWMILRDAAATADVFGLFDLTGNVTVSQMASEANMREGPIRERLETPWFSPLAGDDFKYVSGIIAYDSTTLHWTSSSAALRDQIPGVLLFALTGAGNSAVCGDVFVQYRMELCDVLGVPVESNALKHAARILEQKKKEDAIAMLSTNFDAFVKLIDSDSVEEKRSSSRSSVKSR